MNNNEPLRILAVSLSTEGFGYAVMETDNAFVDFGNKVVPKDKNTHSLTHIEKLIVQYQPVVLILHDVNAKGTFRSKRIKELHQSVVAMARKHKIKVTKLSNTELRTVLVGEPKATKHDMAVRVGNLFPEELADRVPPKRKLWKSQLSRMDIFDAVGLAVVFWMKGKGSLLKAAL